MLGNKVIIRSDHQALTFLKKDVYKRQAYQNMKEEEDNKYQSINIRDRESRPINTELRQPDHLIRRDNNMSRSEGGAWLCPHPNCRASNYNSSRNQCYRCRGPRGGAPERR